MPTDQVGWGRVDLATLKRLMQLHTARIGPHSQIVLSRDRPGIQCARSHPEDHGASCHRQACSRALGKPEDRAIVMIGHDTNLSNIAGMLNINWLIDGRRDDTPPGGALVFELWQAPTPSGYEVRAYYSVQTLEQMRNVSPLTLDKPPARADVFLPGCSTGECEFSLRLESLSANRDGSN